MGIRRILLLMDLLRIRRGVLRPGRRGLLPLPRRKRVILLPRRIRARRELLLLLLLPRKKNPLLPKKVISMKKQSLNEAVFFIPRKESVLFFLFPYILSTLIFYLCFPIADRTKLRVVFSLLKKPFPHGFETRGRGKSRRGRFKLRS